MITITLPAWLVLALVVLFAADIICDLAQVILRRKLLREERRQTELLDRWATARPERGYGDII